jgi:hypothetical protein
MQLDTYIKGQGNKNKVTTLLSCEFVINFKKDNKNQGRYNSPEK